MAAQSTHKRIIYIRMEFELDTMSENTPCFRIIYNLETYLEAVGFPSFGVMGRAEDARQFRQQDYERMSLFKRPDGVSIEKEGSNCILIHGVDIRSVEEHNSSGPTIRVKGERDAELLVSLLGVPEKDVSKVERGWRKLVSRGKVFDVVVAQSFFDREEFEALGRSQVTEDSGS